MAGSELYDDIGTGYSLGRRTDPRWMTPILAALGNARSIADVGAGTGSYEPHDRQVLAIEPSTEMIRQRPHHASSAVRAVAEALPVRDHAVDAALAVLTVHHWTDWRRPAAYLDPRVRHACSALAQVQPEAVERGLRLRQDLDSGRWHERHQDLLDLDQWDARFRLIVSHS